MGREKITIAVHLYPENERDRLINMHIENRDRNKYPHCRDYVMAAIEALETAEDEQLVTKSVLRKEFEKFRESLNPKQMLP